jgi:16S rRNA (uracil1498-N3)-methyltransferase
MPQERYFIDQDLHNTNTIDLYGDEYQHMRVMRTQIKDHVELINGRGVLAKAILKDLKTEKAILEITSITIDKNTLPHLSLAIGITKANKLDIILEKATELLVDEFYFFPSEQSQKKEFPMQRAKNITIAATKQCGRLFLPSIKIASNIKDISQDNHINLFGDIKKDIPPLKTLFSTLQLNDKAVRFFIGPEKGFSPSEKQWLYENLNARSASLATTTLRSETAAIFAVGLLRHLSQS